MIDLLKACLVVVLLATLQASRQSLKPWSLDVHAGSCLQLAQTAMQFLLQKSHL